MHYALKIIQIENSVGVILPEEALTRMKLEMGDTIFLAESPEGYQLTPCDPAVAEQIELAQQIMRDYSDTLKTLAKS